jgi:tetratricopeptide (TPR) repeat protein
MRCICSIACLLLAAFGFAVQPAAGRAITIAAKPAVSYEDRAACLDGPLDDKVVECTRLIESGQVSGGDLVRAHLRRGLMYALFAGDCERGIVDFSTMVRLDERNATGFALRGSCEINIGDFNPGLADLNRAQQLNPREFNVHNGFGRYYIAKGDYDRAIAELTQAIDINSQVAAGFRNRALAYEGKGDLIKALADFRQALSVNSDKRQKPVRDATEGIERIEQKIATIGAIDWGMCFNGPNGEHRIAACGRLITSGNLGKGDLSQAYFQRAVNMIVIRAELDQSLADLNEAIRLDPSHGLAHAIRAARFIRSGNLDRALADLNEAKRLNPNSGIVHNDFGLYYLAIGDYDRALVEFNESLRLFPQFLYAYKNRAVTYEHKGELAAAFADFHVALSMDPAKKEIGGKEAADGIARIEARLAASQGNVTSAAALSSIAVVPGRRFALVIGNDKYENLPQLNKAVNDARAVRDHLGKLGFEVITVEDGNRRTMSEKLTELTGKLGRGDTAFFFFAGHGIAIKDGNYLLPTDTPQINEDQEAMVTREAIGADSIIDALQDRGARVIIMVLDACRDNPFKKAGTRGVGGKGGLGEMRAPEGVFVLYSAGFGQTALDRLSDKDASANSVFTRTFVSLLERPGITLQEIAKITQSEVKKLSATINHAQMPAYYDQIDGALALR